MVKKGNAHFSPKEICPVEYEKKFLTQNSKNIIFGVFKSEKSENISIEIIYNEEAEKKFILLVLIILALFLCCKLNLLDIIETVLMNLITTLIILLRENPHHTSVSKGI